MKKVCMLSLVLLSSFLLISCGAQSTSDIVVHASDTTSDASAESFESLIESSHAEPSSDTTESASSESTVTADSIECEPMFSYTAYGIRMQVAVLDGWEYEVVKSGTEYSKEMRHEGIRIYRTDAPDTVFALLLYEHPFGVCGTGLQTELHTFENGLAAAVFYYDPWEDGDYLWLQFQDEPGDPILDVHGLTRAYAEDNRDDILLLLESVSFTDAEEEK